MFDFILTHGPKNASQQMLGELRIGVMLFLMPQGRVPHAASVKLMTPAEGQFVPDLWAFESVFVRIIQRRQVRGQQNMQVTGPVRQEITFVGPSKGRGEVRR